MYVRFCIFITGYHVARVKICLSLVRLLGDVTPSGETLTPPWGHYTEDWKPDDFDIKQIFLTPSIVYAGLAAYASTLA